MHTVGLSVYALLHVTVRYVTVSAIKQSTIAIVKFAILIFYLAVYLSDLTALELACKF